MLSNADLKDRLDFHANTWDVTCLCVCVCNNLYAVCIYMCGRLHCVFVCVSACTNQWVDKCMHGNVSV